MVPDGIVGADLAEPSTQLLSGDLDDRLTEERVTARQQCENGTVYLREDEEARVRQLLASVNWDPLERPEGLLPWEARTPRLLGCSGFERDNLGGPGRDRTCDQRIMSPLL